MVTADLLKQVNDEIKMIIVKDKPYAQVNDRVTAFRKMCPGGSITTEIISLENGVATMMATVMDEEGRILSTGLAQEKETSSFINKTSFIENCETSAVGRALGFIGIGIDTSIASAEEMKNAQENQNDKMVKDAKAKPITKAEIHTLIRLCKEKGLDVDETFPSGVEALTGEQYLKALEKLKGVSNKK